MYAELALPKPGTNLLGQDPAFANLGYALYLGSSERKESVLFASTADLPLTGRQETTTFPVGDNRLRLVITSTGELGGALLAAASGGCSCSPAPRSQSARRC